MARLGQTLCCFKLLLLSHILCAVAAPVLNKTGLVVVVVVHGITTSTHTPTHQVSPACPLHTHTHPPTHRVCGGGVVGSTKICTLDPCVRGPRPLLLLFSPDIHTNSFNGCAAVALFSRLLTQHHSALLFTRNVPRDQVGPGDRPG